MALARVVSGSEGTESDGPKDSAGAELSIPSSVAVDSIEGTVYNAAPELLR